MLKWQDEMAEKFGLNFTIVDSAQLNQLRRSHGSAANPFRVYPLTIVSLSWLRGAKAERLLHEVTEADGDKRPFDLLILDEAHHVAPAAPKQRYAVASASSPASWTRRLARARPQHLSSRTGSLPSGRRPGIRCSKWQEKLLSLDAARDQELKRVSARYRDIRRHSFPVAVIFVVPRREAVR